MSLTGNALMGESSMAMKIRHENEYGGLDSVCTCNFEDDTRVKTIFCRGGFRNMMVAFEQTIFGGS